jgi:1,4-dihydroxy-2-naphthoyl-CoA synthase
MAYEYVIYQKCDGLEKIRIDRPKKLNALNPDVFGEIGNVLVECEKLVHTLMAKSSVAMRAAKMAVSMAMNVGVEEGIKIEQNAFCMLFGTSDQKEGITSFMDKRKPIFTGK